MDLNTKQKGGKCSGGARKMSIIEENQVILRLIEVVLSA
jgi:hypothetical protein